MKPRVVVALGAMFGVSASCGGSPPPPVTPLLPTMPPPASPEPSIDALGVRPTVPTPAPFVPPTPTVYAGPNGVTVWLLERHTLPFVAVSVSVPTGSSSDPKGKGGLAEVTADMLDEGAGSHDAIDLSRAVDTIGATLSSDAFPDVSLVSMTVLKKNLGPAFAILGDVVVRPRFDATEWKRVRDLWMGDLRERASDPDEVSRVVERVALFGEAHPYGHPTDGTLESARRSSLEDVKKFYQAAWRPDRAVVVAVGDVTRDELTPLLAASFGTWKASAATASAPLAPPAPTGPWPRVVLVDRPDAPQSVIALVRPGVAASDPSAPALSRVNAALGGSFTSRLNQDLREEHGWSYGARSQVGMARGIGQITMSAAVVTDKTLDALKALLNDVETYAKSGMTDEEVDKTRSKARAELVQSYESAGGLAVRLATDAALGLPSDFEAKASLSRDTATKETLNKLAADDFDPTHALVVIVGPRAKLEGPLQGMGLAPIEVRDTDGLVVKASR